jgi:hypothetical protein
MNIKITEADVTTMPDGTYYLNLESAREGASMSIELTELDIVMLAERASHECVNHLEWREAHSVEPHGERFEDAGWACAICGERYSVAELSAMAERIAEEE